IERAIAAFAEDSNGCLIVFGSPGATIHRDLIIALAAKHRLPAVYGSRYFAASGGLISYGPHCLDQHRQAAGYVYRILKGKKPADLPPPQPTKPEMVIQLQPAKTLRRR